MGGKKGQVTIFIIIAIVVIAAAALFLFFREDIIPTMGEAPEKNPNNYLEVCMKDKMREILSILPQQGGYVSNPVNITFKFDDDDSSRDISYLCYTPNYYIPCVNQAPMLITHVNNEITNYISDDVKNCFDKLTSSLNNAGFTVDAKYNGFKVNLMEGKIVVDLDASMTLTKTGETSNYEDLKITTLSRFYDSAMVAQEIISYEAQYCNFEYSGYMILHPQWNIDKLRTSDSTIIYTVKHKDDENRFRFAIRGCVIRPGI